MGRADTLNLCVGPPAAHPSTRLGDRPSDTHAYPLFRERDAAKMQKGLQHDVPEPFFRRPPTAVMRSNDDRIVLHRLFD